MADDPQSVWKPDAPLNLSIEHTAFLLGVCPRTVRNLIARGELTVMKIGGRTLVRRTSIEVFQRKSYHETK